MKKIILICFVLIHSLLGLCQSTDFFKTYDFGNNYSFLNSLYEYNDKLYIGGVLSQPNKKGFLFNVEYNGIIHDEIVLGVDTGNYYGGNYLLLDINKLAVLFAYESPSPSYLTNEYIITTDTNLNIISDTLYQKAHTTFGNNIKFGNNYYFAGITALDNNGDTLFYSGGQLYFNGLIWKTDSNLNLITNNSIGFFNKQENLTIIESGFDNNILLGGLSLANNNQQDWYLVNVDTNGAVLGEYYYGHPTMTDSEGMKSISQGIDSTYFLTGKYYQYDFGPGQYYYAATVIKINRLFQTIWTKRIGTTVKGITVNKILQTYDGNQALLIQRSPVQNLMNIFSQITKFNNNGDILWSRNYYQGDTTDYIRYRAWDMIETSDKGFALCGSAIDTINVGPYQQAWLVKTDSLGCDGIQSCNDTALVCQILQAPDTACKNDTSWLQVRFKGRSAPYYVYANTTLALDSVYYPYTLPLWIDTLVPYYPITTGMQNVIISVKDPWGWQQSDTVQVFVKNCGAGYLEESWYPKKVEIYPNPATNELHVKIKGTIHGQFTITLYNSQGKILDFLTSNKSEFIIDLSGYSEGIYFTRVLGNNLKQSEKIIKQKNNF